jgi:hypothetical protein
MARTVPAYRILVTSSLSSLTTHVANSMITTHNTSSSGRDEGADMATEEQRRVGARYSRRGFIKTVGVGAAGAASVAAGIGLPKGIAAGFTAETPASGTGNTFGRIFPTLPPFFDKLKPSGATTQLNYALADIGKPGGLLDAADQLSAGPVRLITDPSVNGNVPPTNPDNPTHTAGTHFMGQFMDHDVTFDAGSTLGQPTDPSTAINSRTPYFDLDSVYGQGPAVSPQFYNPGDPVKLRIESGGIFEDLARASDETAIIPDPRNDETVIIAGLHCAFILFHNRAVDYARSVEGFTDPDATFAEAKRLTLWHYQWMILNEFLPLFIGPAMVRDILRNGRKFYLPQLGQAVMPVEFQGACYRFGHSMVRPSYRANLKGDNGSPFFGLIFDPTIGNPSYPTVTDPADLRGGFRAPRRFIGWQTFFNFGDGNVKPNKLIDARISTPLFSLPLGAIANHQPPTALPQRTLLRQVTWSMPAGQDIAEIMGVHKLNPSDLSELRVYDMHLEKSTPLWYYALKEAALVPDTDIGKSTGGFHLGPVGGRIVGEVIIGLLQTDPNSWAYQQPGWTPTLQNPGPGFRMTDFLTFAGVDPATRHAQNPTYA